MSDSPHDFVPFARECEEEGEHPHPTSASPPAADEPAYPSLLRQAQDERTLEGRAVCKSERPSHRTSSVAYVAEPPAADDPLLGFVPFVHVAPRRNSITPERQRAFISSLAATGIITQAALSIGASLEALYRLRNRAGAEGFSAAWEAAIDRGMARLEDCALERAIAGEERVVVRGGKVVAT